MRPLNEYLLAVGALLASCLVAVGKPNLDGWGKYKFEMSPDQVMAIPGIKWGDLLNPTVIPSQQEIDNRKIFLYTLSSANSPVYGLSFIVVAFFDGHKRMSSIAGHDNQVAMSETDCEEQFQTLLRGFAHDYGKFTASQKNPRPISSGGPVAQAVKIVAGSKASYRTETFQERDYRMDAASSEYDAPGGSVTLSMGYDEDVKLCNLVFHFSRAS